MSDSTRILRVPPAPDAAPDPGSRVDPLAPATEPHNGASSDLFHTLPSGPIVIHTTHPTPINFPGYEILGELGRGGMGVVYRARQKNLNRLVALKVIIAGPHASSEDKARFRLEAEAGARLRHPNIVQVHDVGEHGGFAYMALELVEGGTLRRWQGEKPVAPRLAVQLAVAVGRGVLHAHENGIVHRDLKPANILIGTEESLAGAEPDPKESPVPGDGIAPVALVPKVTDFGLAKAMEGGLDLTVPGMACGTPNYMAPEQVRGSRRVGPGVDVYGLGAVLYELLTGRPPFVGSDAAEVMDKILRVDPPSIRKVVPTLPRDLSVIVAKCLEKDPARRYLTMRDLLDELSRFLAGLAVQARPIGPFERSCRWVRRNPIPALFLGISACGCAVTSGLAVALARSVAVEHAALTDAERARDDADALRSAAEEARDQLTAALAAAQTQKAAAEAARKRAEENLQIARQVIRTTLYEFSRDTRFEGPEFREYRKKLIASVRQFRDEVASHSGGSVEWLNDLADVSHWLGFLEYLNDNHPQSAAEYRAAADAARKWADAFPKDPEPRWKLTDSLVNEGNALFNHHKLAQAEEAYREAVAVIGPVARKHPTEKYRRTTVLALAQLANVLRFTGTAVEQLHVASAAYREALAVAARRSPENLRLLAAARTTLTVALFRVLTELSPPGALRDRPRAEEFGPDPVD
ncbi:serine threonine protein kinase : WD40 repeat-containing protein OS=Singulisphaera acidiphila (strain ATCC BAA-1392 / DSM 18658 / VKM B-2454 / MOB10) GN=Sinac_7396 PE=3 SV=1: Pkinase [Gemmataceae bacterium]|nr:serine threonine protein kinase : WD40 repeat-containing protein OS=Singulisphaera acidiphila (strain ATCC BAA-1392 / DSM 18658 / VKM B-2454 / MOB10) GN=Sinac_7396 PE=3 SV=1: Pkinase [Gemmataceae bacterium]VTT98441.1 serine threonine protein kinase : WD40 repeat-containing protein OS=Singulisphaera acidiphila (strain ATCC BAA-1392 / DSM 18658 / VKM B-2454 / MOB10) GN=Sinac_7396 PE=3 SV=1: Pkinase [Gemmataceae bacterium]